MASHHPIYLLPSPPFSVDAALPHTAATEVREKMSREKPKTGMWGSTSPSVSPAPASPSPWGDEETRGWLAQGVLHQKKPLPGAEDEVMGWDEPRGEGCSDPTSARCTMAGQCSCRVKSRPASHQWEIWSKLRSLPSRAEMTGGNAIPGFTRANASHPLFWGSKAWEPRLSPSPSATLPSLSAKLPPTTYF